MQWKHFYIISAFKEKWQNSSNICTWYFFLLHWMCKPTLFKLDHVLIWTLQHAHIFSCTCQLEWRESIQMRTSHMNAKGLEFWDNKISNGWHLSPTQLRKICGFACSRTIWQILSLLSKQRAKFHEFKRSTTLDRRPQLCFCLEL